MTDTETLDLIRDLILHWSQDSNDVRPPAQILGDVVVLLAERDAERMISAGIILDIVHGPPHTDD